MNRLILLNVSLLFLGVTYTVAVNVKKAPTARAAIDPWINVTGISEEGDPTSQLFGECIKPLKREEYKPSTVIGPSTGITYWRYELGPNGKNSGPSTWDKVLNVDDIFDCADAAADYRLFKLEGNNCFLSNMTILRNTFSLDEGHPEGQKDVFFINFEIPSSSYVGNGVFINGVNGSWVNFFEYETPHDLDLSSVYYIFSVCYENYNSMPYFETDDLPFATLQKYLRLHNITGEFFVAAEFDVELLRVQWINEERATVEPSFVDAGSYANYENKLFVVISSDQDYKLVVKDFGSTVSRIICAKPAGMA